MITVYHNPRCRKSREALKLLEDKGIDFGIRAYLKDNPGHRELREVLDKLGIKAEQLIRKGEAVYKEQFKGKSLSEEEWIEAMVNHPKLIERPIIITEDKAVIGRPTDKINALF